MTQKPPIDRTTSRRERRAAARETRRKASLLKKEGEGWDIGMAVRFLLSEQARYVTGQHMLVDGGVSFSLKDHLPRKAPSRREGR